MTSSVEQQLPNEIEIVEEILSRLPTKYVLRCRSVCKKWKALTSTLHFGWLHKKNHHESSSSSSSDLAVLVEEELIRPNLHYVKAHRNNGIYYKAEKKRYLLDDCRLQDINITHNSSSLSSINKNMMMIIIPGFRHREEDDQSYYLDEESRMHMSCSSDGLLVLYSKMCVHSPFSTHFFIFNPITGDKVKIAPAAPTNENSSSSTVTVPAPAGLIYGVFFHPLLKEFCVLWGKAPSLIHNICSCHKVIIPNNPLEEDYFQLLNLGPSPPRWKKINNQSTARILKQHQVPRVLSSDAFALSGGASPLVLDNVLYWMVDERTQKLWPNPRSCEEAILAFDTIGEEFHLFPHPGRCPCHQEEWKRLFKHSTMHLLMNDHLDDLTLFESSSTGAFPDFNCIYNPGSAWLLTIWAFKSKKTESSFSAMIANGCWIKMRTIKHEVRRLLPPLELDVMRRFSWPCFRFKPIALINNGELLLVQWEGLGRLFMYNLKSGTGRLQFDAKTSDDSSSSFYSPPLGGSYGAFMCAHTHTFIPMRNSHPQILLPPS